MERQPRLENQMTDSSGRVFQVYETNFEKVFNKYQRNMANYIATMKYFPEFTEMKRFVDPSGSALAVLEGLKQAGDIGVYANTAIKRRVGLERESSTMEGIDQAFTWAGKYSAMIGLSSPMSGIKNFAIGTNMAIGVYGVRAYLHLSLIHI